MRATMRGLRTDAERFSAYVSFNAEGLCDERCMLGCQTKMVLGLGCNQNVDVGHRIEEAKAIVEGALFGRCVWVCMYACLCACHRSATPF